MPDKKTYTVDEVQVLTVMTAIRKRPHMFVGGTRSEPNVIEDPEIPVRLLKEVLCTSIAAAHKGNVKRIGVDLFDQGKARIWDDGPSWDPTIHEMASKRAGYPLSLAEMHLTMLFACRDSLWGCEETDHLHDLCELGIVTTNALCSLFELEIRRDGQLWKQTYRQGEPERPLEVVPFYTRSEDRNGLRPNPTGVDIFLQLDGTIIKSLDFDLNQLVKWCEKVKGPEFVITKGGPKVVIPSAL